MPTKTFFNLPKEKKIRILKAGKKEFSRVPLEKAVIANIAKDAGIPRGSFYQYFQSLEDLFAYIIEYLYGLSKRKFENYLKENNNDIYEALKVKFANELEKLTKEENKQFRINTMNILFEENKYPKEFINCIFTKSSNLDLGFFPEEYQNSKFSDVVDLLKIVSDNCLQQYLTSTVSKDKIKEDYNKYIDFLKVGFSKL